MPMDLLYFASVPDSSCKRPASMIQYWHTKGHCAHILIYARQGIGNQGIISVSHSFWNSSILSGLIRISRAISPGISKKGCFAGIAVQKKRKSGEKEVELV